MNEKAMLLLDYFFLILNELLAFYFLVLFCFLFFFFSFLVGIMHLGFYYHGSWVLGAFLIHRFVLQVC